MPKMLVDNPKNLPVMDLKEPVLVRVASKHIKKATPMSSTSCAMALACKDQVPGLVGATINKSVSYLTFKDRIERGLTPQSLAREIIALDRNGAFAEGDYRLNPPHKTARLGETAARRKRDGGKRNGSRPMTKRPRHVTVMVRGS